MGRFMNQYEIEERRNQYRRHPLLGPATHTLESLMEATNRNSDGWAYWPKPSRAASRLMDLIERDGTSKYRFDDERPDVTLAELKAAYAPLRAFRTRSGLVFTIYEPRGGEDRNRPSHPHSRAERKSIETRLTRRSGRRRYRGR